MFLPALPGRSKTVLDLTGWLALCPLMGVNTMTLQDTLRLNAALNARSRITASNDADASMARRNARIVGGEYAFLRVRNTGYDLGKRPDPDNLLPTYFQGK